MIKLRIALLGLMLSGALFSSAAAIRSIKNAGLRALPKEIYAELLSRGGEAEYCIKIKDSYVAVFSGEGRELIELTPIETVLLRKADRAMLEQGIPVKNKTELLRLLEDLGS